MSEAIITRTLIKELLSSFTSVSESYYQNSGNVPEFYPIGVTSYGPYSVDVDIYADGYADDDLFIFEGSDPKLYPEYPEVGNTSAGYVWYAYTGYGRTHNFYGDKLATIPAGKIFSVMLVDTSPVDVKWEGSITIKSTIDETVNFKIYGFSISGEDYFEITKSSKQNSSELVVGRYTYEQLPTIKLEADTFYRLWHIHYEYPIEEKSSPAVLLDGVLVPTDFESPKLGFLVNDILVPTKQLSSKNSDSDLCIKVDNGEIKDVGANLYELNLYNLAIANNNIVFDRSRITIPGPGVDLSVDNWWIEFKVKFLQFNMTQDFIQKGDPSSSHHDYRIRVNPKSDGIINIIFDSISDSTDPILNINIEYNPTEFNIFRFERLSHTNYKLTVNNNVHTWSSNVEIIHTQSRSTYIGTEDIEGINWLFAEVEYVTLKSGENKSSRLTNAKGLLINNQLYLIN